MSQMKEGKPEGVGVLVLDMQAKLLASIAQKENLSRRVKFVLHGARLFNIPVAFTEQNAEKLGATDEQFSALCPEAPRFNKMSFSAFGSADLLAWIESHDLHHLILCGIETPVCVYQTVLEAEQHDLSITLLVDAVGERRSEDRNAVLNAMAGPHCHILPSETVFYSLLQTAEHPLFREFTQLVKTS